MIDGGSSVDPRRLMGYAQLFDPKPPLPLHSQRLPTGRKHVKRRIPGEQGLNHAGRSVDDVFAVVEQQQQMTLS